MKIIYYSFLILAFYSCNNNTINNEVDELDNLIYNYEAMDSIIQNSDFKRGEKIIEEYKKTLKIYQTNADKIDMRDMSNREYLNQLKSIRRSFKKWPALKDNFSAQNKENKRQLLNLKDDLETNKLSKKEFLKFLNQEKVLFKNLDSTFNAHIENLQFQIIKFDSLIQNKPFSF